MAAPITSSTAPDHDSNDDWEFINDDGFVYKRKKRRLDPTAFARPSDPAPDPAVEESDRRKRKRKTLLKLRNKYKTEIGLWEHLSNTLQAMEESAKSNPELQIQQRESSNEGSQSGVPMEKGSGSLVSELLLQVEAQEAIIRDFSHLCDVAESLCNAQEEKTKQSFLDLPVWASPRELMASLCED